MTVAGILAVTGLLMVGSQTTINTPNGAWVRVGAGGTVQIGLALLILALLISLMTTRGTK